jgi:cytochrome P450
MTKQTVAPTDLEIAGKGYVIPADYMLTLNLTALHYSEKHWGADAADWRPARFLKNDELVVPAPAGTFLPWVNGPRVCPGKKFAQVEFVATLATCLRKHRLRAVSKPSESKEQTVKRVIEVAGDSEMGVNPTLKMKRPEKVEIRWEEVRA